jgi:XTP/dITP diphosphohydrolase
MHDVLGGDDALAELVEVMRRLRTECAWKADQTHESLVPFLREETEELVEAIESGDLDHVREELGDVLLQVVFHAAIAEQAGAFTLDDVARGITAKMRRRNPHVFDPASIGRSPDDPPLDAVAIDELWERIKREERERR